MSKPAFTPGPWTMETVRTSVGVCFKVGPFPWKNGKLNHACIYADYPSPSSFEYKACVANAILIAAAPDLFEALQGLLETITNRTETDPACVKARAALKKALGDTK